MTLPPLLREIPVPPCRLHVAGDSSLLTRPAIAVVGTRLPSPYGLRAAYAFARRLAERGFVVVSGLAHGIDTAAHRGALSAGGRTVAVLGHGLDRVYPAANRALAAQIAASGALVSEYEPGVPPRKHHFPERNRILAGLALGTLVIEAAPRSGSLITAGFALQSGREVFAVAGPFDDPRFAGSHWLLQQGAKLVTTAADLVEELPPETVRAAAVYALQTSPYRGERLRELMGDSVVALGELAARFPGRPTELIGELQIAIAAGAVMEIAPQQYLWTGEARGAHFSAEQAG